MRTRRLQQRSDDGQWEDHGYAYERADGHASFRYNTLVWGRIGAQYNVQMRENNTALEDVDLLILPGENLQWLPVELIGGEEKEIKAMLDRQCHIPQPQRIVVKTPEAA